MSQRHDYYDNWAYPDSVHQRRSPPTSPYHDRNYDPRRRYDRHQQPYEKSWTDLANSGGLSTSSLKNDVSRDRNSGSQQWDAGSSGKSRGGLGGIFIRFSEKCSMQGPSYILGSKRWWSRVVWVVLFLAAMAVMGFHLFYLCKKYLEWPVKNTITLGFSSLQFPAVTICNVNPVRASKLKDMSEEFQNFVQLMDPGSIGQAIDSYPDTDDNARRRRRRRKRRQASTSTDYDYGQLDNLDFGFDSSNFSNAWEDVDDNFYQDNLDGFDNSWESEGKDSLYAELEDRFRQLYAAEDKATRVAAGHQIRDMLVSCSFAGKACYASNFTLSTSMTFGNCFTLQYNKFVSRQSGPRGGLELMLYLQTDEYLRGLTPDDGLQVSIHHQRSASFPADDGLAVAGGAHTFLSMKLIQIERMGDPYSKCTRDSTFLQNYNIIYTRQTCEKLCEQKLVHQRCKCRDETKEDINSIMKVDSLPPCRNSTEVECMTLTTWDYRQGLLSCDCLNPCSESKYEKTLSFTPWPNNFYSENVLVKSVCRTHANATCQRLRDKQPYELPHEFAMLNIFYEDLNYENITEEADYEDVQFVSDVGGTVGLWIGLSLLSVMEVLQLAAELLRYFCCCRWKQS